MIIHEYLLFSPFPLSVLFRFPQSQPQSSGGGGGGGGAAPQPGGFHGADPGEEDDLYS